MSLSLFQALSHVATEAGASEEEARHALDQAALTASSPIDALLDQTPVDEQRLFALLAAALDLPLLEPDPDPEPNLHTRFPTKLALRYRLFPNSFEEGTVTLLTCDPFDLDARQAVGEEIAAPVRWALCDRHTIIESLKDAYGVGAEHWEEMIEGRDPADEDDLRQEVTSLDEEDEDATVMTFVNQIFREALRERATDIHMEPLENDLRIRYRIDGDLEEVPVPPNMRILQASLISRLKIMAQLNIAEKRLPQDGRINLELDGNPIDVRVATIPSVHGESVALRLLTRQKFDFDSLHLEPELAAQIRDLLGQPNGIMLVTGPTGSGKSTTLYTFLRQLNTKDTRIVTIEDPVENKLDGVVQIAVKPEIDLTFANGLRSILRGDPDIIMVGEMRDQETAEIAIRGALTGHLVFSTLHTNDAIGGISRLIDMGVEPFLIQSSVRAFQAQRLVRMLCDACKTPAQISDAELDAIGFPADPALRAGICKPVGCRACRNTGYRDRMAIMELARVTHALGELITQEKPASLLRQTAIAEGMIPIRQYGFIKAGKGQTSLQEVIAITAAS
jgi:general secretion pathway protein E